jgi:hypothetical protein
VSEQALPPAGRTVARRVDRAGRISILKHRYHVGRHLAGQRVVVQSVDGLLHVSHDGVLVATHARRRLETFPRALSRDHRRGAKPCLPQLGAVRAGY